MLRSFSLHEAVVLELDVGLGTARLERHPPATGPTRTVTRSLPGQVRYVTSRRASLKYLVHAVRATGALQVFETTHILRRRQHETIVVTGPPSLEQRRRVLGDLLARGRAATEVDADGRPLRQLPGEGNCIAAGVRGQAFVGGTVC